MSRPDDQVAATLAARPDIGTLQRASSLVYYVTTDRQAGTTIEAADPADLPTAEEVERLQFIAKARGIYRDCLTEIADDLAGRALGFHLVTETLMCVVWAPDGPGFCLGALLTSKGRPFTAASREIAEEKAALWNGQLTGEQAAYGATVEVLDRKTALERLAVQTRGLLDVLNGR